MADSILPNVPLVYPTQAPQELQVPDLPQVPVTPPLGEQKKAEVSQMSDAKKLLLSGSQQADVAAASLANRNNLTGNNQVLLDAATLTPDAFEAKYGQGASLMQSNLTAARQRTDTVLNRERTAGEVTSDIANSVGQGALNSVGGIAALGAGVVDPRAGSIISEALASASEGMRSYQSPALNQRRQLEAIQSELDTQDNQEQYEKDVETDGEVLAGLKKVGRDAVDAIARNASDPTLLSDGVAQGVGSLVVTGPLARGIGAAASIRGVLGEAGKRVVERAAVPTAIGAMEAGGAYSQTSQEVLDMSFDDLERESSLYRQRLAEGDTQEQARAFVANRAGLIAAPIAGVAGAAAGNLVSRFEAAPFRVPSVGSAVGNIIRETTEEGLQSATGQIASNVGIRETADANRNILDDVGQQVGTGALFGAGTAGVVQTPGATLRAARNAVSGVINTAIERGERIRQQNEAASPASAEVINSAVEDAVQNVPSVVEGLQQAAGTNRDNPEVQDFINRVESTAVIYPEEIQSLPESIRSTIPETNNRFDVIARVAAQAITSQNVDDKIYAALFVREQLRENEAIFNSDLPSALRNLDQNSEQYQQFDDYRTVLDSIRQHPEINRVFKMIEDAESLPDTENITPQVVDNSVRMAEFNPSAVNPETNDRILYQADQGNIELNDAQRAVIQASSTLVRAQRQYASDLQEMGQPLSEETRGPTMQEVNNQIERASNDPQKLSMNEHLSGILQAVQSGDNNLARRRAQRLARFALHMNNKVDALNRSYAQNGEKVNYVGLDPQGEWMPENKSSLFVKPRSAGSVKLAQQIYAEARAVSTLANNIAQTFPEFGLSSIAEPSLVPALRQPADMAVAQNRIARQVPENRIEEADRRVVEEPSSEPIAQANEPVQTAPAETTTTEVEREPEAVQEPEETTTETVQEVSESVQRTESETNEGVRTESEPEARTVENQYPNLLKIGDKPNWFHKAFKFPTEMTSNLVGQENAVEFVRSSLKPTDQFKYAFDRGMARAYRSYVEFAAPVIGEMNSRLLKAITRVSKGKNGDYTLISASQDGVEVNRWLAGKALNIVEDGSGTYNRELQQQAVLAGLHWVLNAERTSYPMDREDIAKDLNIEEADVTEDMINAFNRGVSITEAKRGLADIIQQFWGVRSDNNVGLGYTKGIPEAIASEVLYGLQAANLIQLDQVTVETQNQEGKVVPKQLVRVYFDTHPENIQNIIDTVKTAPEAIGDIVLTENNNNPISIGTPPARIADTQMRNPLVRNTKQQRDAIRAAQNIPFYVNQTMLDLLNQMGSDNVVSYFGGELMENRRFNQNHEISVIGKNRGLVNSFNNINLQYQQMQNYANGSPVTEVPVYYEHNVSRVGRLQMAGNSNPQSDKMAREVFVSTRTNLDMTNPDNVNRFWMTIAQALGVKTEKLPRAEAVAKAQSKINDLKDHMPAFEDFVQNGTKIPTETLNAVSSYLGSDLSFKAIHALVSVAKLNTATDLTNFEHFLSLEADGKTDGPINALVHMASGPFSSSWIRNVAKGGLFFGSENKTLNAHQAEDDADLYQEATTKLSSILNEFRSHLNSTSPEVADMSVALLRVMNALSDGDVVFDGSEVTLKRGVAKNPLTITIYGSGIDGIAGKVAGGLIDNFYSMLSNILQGNGTMDEQLTKDLELLTQNAVRFNRKENRFFRINENDKKVSGSAQKFTFDKEQMDIFRSNVKALFVNQMNQAIEEMMDGSLETTRKLQKAIQVQSLVLENLFEQQVQERIAAKKQSDPDFKESDFLSQNELNQIYRDLEQYSPLIETGTQTFLVGGSERTDVAASTFARALTTGEARFENVNTPAYVFGPTDAGVAGIPYMVIGTGDAQMVQNVITHRNAPDGALYVFDGIELKADRIDQDSSLINESVFDGWMGNPVMNVSNSFSAFLRENPLDLLNEAGKQRVMEALYGNKASESTWEEATADISDLNTLLRNDAQEIEARHRVMDRVTLSVDHMASAESPFTNQGEALPSDPRDMIQRLNELFNEELNKIKSEGAKTPVQKQASEFQTAVLSLGSEDSDSGARVLTTSDLASVKNVEGVSDQHKEWLKVTATNLEDQGYKIVVGTPSQVAKYEAINDPQNYNPRESLDYGKINFANKTIYISNITPETVVHELLHASTFDKVARFYENESSIQKEDADAIKRLEGLMNEWLFQNYNNESLPAQEARQMAYSAVAGWLNQNRPAEALNEFMAWSLSNQALSEVQKRTKVKKPKFRILGAALNALKKLFNVRVDDTLFSNIRFNTRVLTRTPSDFRDRAVSTILHQSSSFGSDERLLRLRQTFWNKIMSHVRETDDPVERAQRQSTWNLGYTQGQNIAAEFERRGFTMNMQEGSTFQMLYSAFATEIALNPSSLARIQDVYADVTKKLTVESFMSDPNSQDPNDRYIAQEKFNVLNGVFLTKTDSKGRSSLLPAFLALSMVNQEFRNILSNIETTRPEHEQWNTVDGVLENLGSEAMNRLSSYMAGEGIKNRPKNVQDQLDALTESLIDNVGDQRTFIEQASDRYFSGFESYISENIQNLSDKLTETSRAAMQSNNRLARAAGQVGFIMAGIVNNETAEHIANGVTSAMNTMNVWTPLRELTTEIIGRTKENASVFDMISLVRSAVQQTRQQFREHLPTKIANHFSRELSETEWSVLHKSLGKTDIASLLNTFDMNEVINYLVDDQARKVVIDGIERDLQISEGRLFDPIKRKADELAEFLVNGKVSGNLLRNAYAIANLFGVGGRQATATQQVIQNVDHLVTLYAINKLDASAKAVLSDLVQNQKDGLNFAVSYLQGQRADEQTRIGTGAARANHYKGYIPSENQIGTSLIVADDTEYARLVSLGFERVADYFGSQAEGRGIRRGYYYSTVSGRAAFNQGVLQTVRTTASGVDPINGRTVQDLTAGYIDNPDEVKRITRRMASNQNAREPLMPVYSETGDVIAYERSIDPSQLARMNRNTHLGQMIGAWRGRQVEEALARDFNKQLINNLAQIWDEQKNGRRSEFINLADLSGVDDPVLHDAWDLVSAETRTDIEEAFGGDGFWVRKDMLNDALGFRSASVGDAWTGTTRWKPAVTERLKLAATGVFGNNAYKYLTQAEKFGQNVVSDLKVLIVVKSVIVPAANMLSNGYQLIGRGVPLRNIIKGFGEKTTEINQYIKNRERQIELEADLRAATGDLVKQRKINTELQSILDSNKRMSIAPLIEAGEFSSISDGGVTQEDLALSNGRFVDLLEQQVSKLPDGIQTLGKYAFVTKDTALFRGLARSVQYGDFIAKAVLYDDLIQRKKLSKEEALAQVGEEFVNYNRLAGRTRNYLESIGLLWFWNFKLRSMKVAASMIRNNPVRALLSAVAAPTLPIIGSIGSPVTDNFLSVLANGKLDYSIGPGMGLNAWKLNPWANIVD